MVASVKTPLISVDVGAALKDMRTGTESTCGSSLGQHHHCFTQHNENNAEHSSFPSRGIPLRWPPLSGALGNAARGQAQAGVVEVDSNTVWNVYLKLKWLETTGVIGWSSWESGWEMMISGGSSPCFLLSALPSSTSASDCGVNGSPRRDIKMGTECLGKLLTLFWITKLSHTTKQVPSGPQEQGQLIQWGETWC